MIRTGSIFLLIIIPFILFAQDYPKGYFRSPVTIPIYLSGSFAELRYNHFHSGIDIKTEGKEGLPIVAAADGHVSRIKVSPYGFGKALYLDHPNGYSTVYAHLSRFNPAIEEAVRKAQYQNENYSIELFPGSGDFRVKKGDTIAWSGNSGGSAGPHLHFEVRETKTEYPVNPLLFGFDINDDVRPVIHSIKIYPLERDGAVKIEFTNRLPLVSRNPVELNVTGSKGNYSVQNVREICGKGKLGIAVETYDYHNGSSNRLGAYGILLKDTSGNIYYKHELEKFGFHQTRYINAHLDFKERITRRKKYQRCYILPGNDLPVYRYDKKPFTILVDSGADHNLIMEIKDSYGNTSTLPFKLKYFNDTSSVKRTVQGIRKFPFNKASLFKDSVIDLAFPAGAFYEDIDFTYSVEGIPSHKFSYLHKVHTPFEPVHKNYTLGIKCMGLPERLRDKVVIRSIDEDGDHSEEGGAWKNGWVYTRTRVFGDFYIDVDTVKPEIRLLDLYENKNIGSQKTIRVRIDDELSGINTYYPTIDGKWVLMEYDAKYNLLIYDVGESLSPGKHLFSIVVKDDVGNENKVSVNFIK